jgi:hypothetical protein
MKIYVSCYSKPIAAAVADHLTTHGMTVTSDWHKGGGEIPRTATISDGERREKADHNRRIIMESEGLLVVAPNGLCPGGIFVEAGIARGRGLPVFNIGRVANLMLWESGVEQFDSVDDFLRSRGQTPLVVTGLSPDVEAVIEGSAA